MFEMLIIAYNANPAFAPLMLSKNFAGQLMWARSYDLAVRLTEEEAQKIMDHITALDEIGTGLIQSAFPDGQRGTIAMGELTLNSKRSIQVGGF